MANVVDKWNRYTTLLLPMILAVVDYITVMGAVYAAYVIRKSGFLLAAHPSFEIKGLYIFFIVPIFSFWCYSYVIPIASIFPIGTRYGISSNP